MALSIFLVGLILIILSPFKIPIREQLFVSIAGLRGASAIVFAIYAFSNYPQSSSLTIRL
ncbi:MAG: hypothetical protein JXR63_07850 [Spirochaetales bacterium]|nr:hypothetical protein [Spirochaetales bacterium]